MSETVVLSWGIFGEAANAHLKNVGALLERFGGRSRQVEFDRDSRRCQRVPKLVKPAQRSWYQVFRSAQWIHEYEICGNSRQGARIRLDSSYVHARRQGEGASDHETIRGGHQEQRDRMYLLRMDGAETSSSVVRLTWTELPRTRT